MVGRIGKSRKRLRSPPLKLAMLEHRNERSVEGEQVCYFGMKSYDRTELFKVIAMHILQTILLRLGSEVTAHNSIPQCFLNPDSADTLHSIVWRFRRRSDAGGHEYDNRTVEWQPSTEQNPEVDFFRNKSFKHVAQMLGDLLQDQAKEGAVLSGVLVRKADYDGQTGAARSDWGPLAFQMDDIELRRVSLTVRMRVKIQNITPGDGESATSNINDIRANALTGRCYDFKHPTPRFRNKWLYEGGWNRDDGSTKREVSVLQNTILDDPALDTQYLREFTENGTIRTFGSLITPFSKPPKNPSTIFQNLSASTPVDMKPGGFTSVNRLFSFNGNLRDLCLGVYGDRTVLPVVGTSTAFNETMNAVTGNCTMLGLEQTMRLPTGNNLVKLLLNEQFTYTFTTRPRRRRPLPVFNATGQPPLP